MSQAQEAVNPMPRSVRKQADKANELMNRLVASAQSAPASGEPATTAGEPQGPAAAPAPASPAATSSGSAPAPAAPSRQEDSVDYWKHRFSVLQGKYNAEVPALQQQVMELTRSAPVTVPPASPSASAPAPSGSSISAEEIEEYGQDFFDVVGRRALEVIRPVLEQMVNERIGNVASKVERITTSVEQTATERFFRDLGELVPTWATINQEQGWLEWLDEVDQFSGQTRQALLNDARAKLDARRAAALFKAYGESSAQHAHAAPGAATGQHPRLQDFAEPSVVRAGAASPAGSGTGRIWTPDLVNKFYGDVRRGIYVGREAEKRQIEDDIQRAGTEGRYRRA